MDVEVKLYEKLRDLRDERKLTLAELEKEVGIPVSTLGRIENEHRSGIAYQDLYRLAKFYNVSTDYLFGLTDNRHYNNEDTKSLSLSDEALDVLKSEKLNNRLLCEIIAHPNFPALLSSIEVYIDRTLMPQLNAINAMYELVERVIRKEFEVRAYEDI